MSGYFNFTPHILELAAQAEKTARPSFSRIEEISAHNTEKVLWAFGKHRVSDSMFAGTTGYGYNDTGRETLDALFADLFGAESALVRLGFVNGTHAISAALFAAVRPGTTLLSATGAPYDTLMETIGTRGGGGMSLRDYGVIYRQCELSSDGLPDLDGIKTAAADNNISAVFIQRSKGYSARRSLSCRDIENIVLTVRSVNRHAAVVVDNCYGEFAETREPCEAGADLVAGSLIKNPGGGLAPAGGYIVGRRELVERAAFRLTAPGIGGECGSTLGQNRLLFQGLFMAPHVVGEALKTAVFCASLMSLMGYPVNPPPGEVRYDIIQSVELGGAEKVLAFCRGIQSCAPVDSFAAPEPWDMPGYDCPVVMAAGAFVQGASIELSADAPMREPYTVFMQGGLTFDAGRLGVMRAAQNVAEVAEK